MIKLYENAIFITKDNKIIDETNEKFENLNKDESKRNTLTYDILKNHNTSGNMENLQIKFDAMASHDITYVGIIQTAKASGMKKFPLPYVLTNCHNSLSAVGGTINEDDHVFGLSAAKKYGGIFVPPHFAVIHSYMREMMSGCGKMILGSDSHTRYGALGTMAIGEGGGELAKQLLGQTYDIKYPGVVGVYLTGNVKAGVGPHDVALSIIGSVFKSGFVKNKVMEFMGDGISNLDVGFRNGIDVMTTETTCLSSIWETDDKTKEYFKIHNRENDFVELKKQDTAYYDGLIYVDLSEIKPMIAMPFHPSNVYEIEYVNNNLEEVLSKVEKDSLEFSENTKLNLLSKVKNNKLYVDQGIIAGCSGGIYENICAFSNILDSGSITNKNLSLSVYPDSQPSYLELVRNGTIGKLMEKGIIIRSAFCGPCFGAGDVPANEGFSIRHTTRNFPNRDGSKPGDGQMTGVALMDARSIAATIINGGVLTPATDLNIDYAIPKYFFNEEVYKNRVYNGFENPKEDEELIYAPNIIDWPEMISLTENVLLKTIAYITDPVTTTDELIPSGETSSYRSNPLKLAEFTLSRKEPKYVARAKEIFEIEKQRQDGENVFLENKELTKIANQIKTINNEFDFRNTSVGSLIYATKPGDGSAREQAASCQKVLGGLANITKEYATKRYRSNLINWGILPFVLKEPIDFKLGDYIFVPNVKSAIKDKLDEIKGYIINEDGIKEFKLTFNDLTDKEREILLSGSLINYNKKQLENLDTNFLKKV